MVSRTRNALETQSDHLVGSRQSGDLFRAKLQVFEKLLKRAFNQSSSGEIELFYPTAPFALEAQNATSKLREKYGEWTWFKTETVDACCSGLEDGLRAIAEVLKTSGPVDGIVGFSEGAAAAAMVASLLEGNRRDAFEQMEHKGGIVYPTAFASLDHPPLRFVVSFAGYPASHEAYQAFYNPPIRTPMLHFLGSMDNVVDETASMRLVESCQGSGETEVMIIRHSGGHVVPSEKRELAVAVGFIRSFQVRGKRDEDVRSESHGLQNP